MVFSTKTFSGLAKKLFSKKEYVAISGAIIPAAARRCCGTEFKNHRFYLESAETEARRLVSHFGCNQNSRIMDIGCGQGRLAIGLHRVVGAVKYLGLDVDQSSIDWCRRYIGHECPTFQFKHLGVYNERYNRNGGRIDEDFKFEVDPGSIDIINLFSVFSHTIERDMRIYLADFLRILKPSGKVFFTTFVEDDVPGITINPPNYVLKKCAGPLHIVRYNKTYLFSILEEMGFGIERFTHATETDRQSAIYLGRK